MPRLRHKNVRDEFSTLPSLPTFPEPVKLDRHCGLQGVAVKPVRHDFSSLSHQLVAALTGLRHSHMTVMSLNIDHAHNVVGPAHPHGEA